MASFLTRHAQLPPSVEGMFMRASAPRDSTSCMVVMAMPAGDAQTLLMALQPMASLVEVRR